MNLQIYSDCLPGRLHAERLTPYVARTFITILTVCSISIIDFPFSAMAPAICGQTQVNYSDRYENTNLYTDIQTILGRSS